MAYISDSSIRRVRFLPHFLAAAQLGLMVCLTQPVHAQSAAYPSLSRLSSLLDTIPQGGWVQVNTNNFDDAWPTGNSAVNIPGNSSPAGIIHAWSSTAWDSTSGNLILWGGGHANYAGNEVYVWDGASGQWTRGSLPSQVVPVNTNSGVYTIPDNAAPMSSHTYDNNIYLPVNNMFLTLGGAQFNTGGYMTWTAPDGSSVRTGPWLWDPTLANANLVGGTSGSGYDPTVAGGNMWINRADSILGVNGASNGPSAMTGSDLNGTAAYVTENGHDVVYLTYDNFNSGFPYLFKYTLGDVRNGGTDTWEMVGYDSGGSVGFKGAATIDTTRNLYIRTADNLTTYRTWTSELMAWHVGTSVSGVQTEINIDLVNPDGSDFAMNGNFGLDYNSANDRIYLYDGSGGGGAVYYITPDSNSNTWVVRQVPSTATAHPLGDFQTGVLGKWDYIAELDAYIVVDEYQTGDLGGVWLFKPDETSGLPPDTPTAPEPATLSLLLAGLFGGAYLLRRRRSY